jgi:hypothetical protein
MPYISKWVSAALAIAHVMRREKCDRAAAMQQIEAAARDGALRWVRGCSNRWDWDAEVFRRDLLKLWPAGPTKGDSAAQLEEAAIPAEAKTPSDLRKLLEAAAGRHDAIPDRAELQRLGEALANLRIKVGAIVQAREAQAVPADVIEKKCRQANEEAERELLAWLAGGQLAVWVDTHDGLERLPYGLYWTNADEGATLKADRVLAEGSAPSNRYLGLTGTVMVRADKFQVFAEHYLASRDLAENGVSSPTVRRAEPAVSNSDENRYWKPLDEAVDCLTRRGMTPDRAWAAIKEDIAAGELKARCRARRYDQQQASWIDIWRDLDPRWLGFTAYGCIQDNHLRFDQVAAIRARMLGEKIDLPPEHARDIAVDTARLNELYPPVVEEKSSPAPLVDDEAAVIVSPRDRAGSCQPVARRPSRQKPFWPDARKVAFDWLDEKGSPVPGDGGLANLEKHIATWLMERGHEAAESTIRKHVHAWIEEYKASPPVLE